MVEVTEYERLRQRPTASVAMRQNWRDLLFAHYAIEPALIQPLIPRGLDLDTFPDASGREMAWIGVVPFRMFGIRPLWSPPVPLLSAFLETNVRTYVHRDGNEPGVWFFSLDAARWLACKIARMTYDLPYYWAKMQMQAHGEVISYESRRIENPRPANLSVRFTIGDRLPESVPGTIQYWLVERYLLYSEFHRSIRKARVFHTPYGLNEVQIEQISTTLPDAAGIPSGEWTHFCYSPGVDVEVFGPEAL